MSNKYKDAGSVKVWSRFGRIFIYLSILLLNSHRFTSVGDAESYCERWATT